MLKCADCCDGKSEMKCSACRKMQQEGKWQWELDNGNRMIRCPDCGFGIVFGAYAYTNKWKYCPGCGQLMNTFEQTTMI